MVPVAARATTRAWVTALQIVVALLVAFALGTLGCAFFDSWSAHAQQIQIDTSTAQYKENKKYIDSLVQGPFVQWAKRFPVPFWRITIRVDSLGSGDSPNHVTQSHVVAETYVNEPYHNAMVIMDVRRLKALNPIEVFVHEMWHIALSPYTWFVNMFFDGHDAGPLSGLLRLNEERLVTDLTRTLLWR